MTARAGFQELHESENRALTLLFNRTGWQMGFENGQPVPVVAHSFSEAIAAEEDGESAETVGEYEIRQRMIGARGFIRFLQAHGPHPTEMLKQLADACRAMHIAPFHLMTMEEQAMLFGQGKAAVSFRGKVISREIELGGMHASKIPGQKSKDASKSYRKREEEKKAAQNRTDGPNGTNRRHGAKTRQKSFLRQLRVKPAKKTRLRKPDTGKLEQTINGSKAAA